MTGDRCSEIALGRRRSAGRVTNSDGAGCTFDDDRSGAQEFSLNNDGEPPKPTTRKKQYKQLKRSRTSPFHFGWMRVAEITRLIQSRHGSLPDTDDRSIYVEAVAWHLDCARDLEFSLDSWARRLGVVLTPNEITRAACKVRSKPRRFAADAIADSGHRCRAHRP
jgi:hypothetical protein